MGGKSRKSGGVSAKLIAALKNGTYSKRTSSKVKTTTTEKTKQNDTKSNDKGLFGNG